MSIPITKIEATVVARFLSATHSHIDEAIQSHVTWLNALARAYGYRNWNALKPNEEVPNIGKLGIGARRFAFACIDLPGKERSFRAVCGDTSEASMQSLATAMASAVSKMANFRGLKFQYSRPDPRSPPPMGAESSAATTPVVATATRGGAKIVLWWIQVFLRKSYRNQDRIVIGHISFEHCAQYDERNPTDCFLEALTGVAEAPRKCLYVPLETSPPYLSRQEAFYPLILTEGKTDGQEADWNYGLDRMLAVRCAYLKNRCAGLSNLDINDIVDQHRRIEPDPNEEPELDFYWLSED